MTSRSTLSASPLRHILLAALALLLAAGAIFPGVAAAADASAYAQQDTGASVSVSQTINLRSGPGTAFSRVGQLRAGQSLPILGKNQDGSWWQVQLSDGSKAWIAAWLVRASGAVDQVAVAQD
ncbi:MAG: SH3 domain-containing protein, partial [Anaerolineae bacterium]